MNAPSPRTVSPQAFAERPEAARAWLERLGEIAVSAVHPDTLLPDRLPEPPAGRTLVVGAGKAAAAWPSPWNAPGTPISPRRRCPAWW